MRRSLPGRAMRAALLSFILRTPSSSSGLGCCLPRQQTVLHSSACHSTQRRFQTSFSGHQKDLIIRPLLGGAQETADSGRATHTTGVSPRQFRSPRSVHHQQTYLFPPTYHRKVRTFLNADAAKKSFPLFQRLPKPTLRGLVSTTTMPESTPASGEGSRATPEVQKYRPRACQSCARSKMRCVWPSEPGATPCQRFVHDLLLTPLHFSVQVKDTRLEIEPWNSRRQRSRCFFHPGMPCSSPWTHVHKVAALYVAIVCEFSIVSLLQ